MYSRLISITEAVCLTIAKAIVVKRAFSRSLGLHFRTR